MCGALLLAMIAAARRLVVDEASANWTAAPRADLFPDAERAAFLEEIRNP